MLYLFNLMYTQFELLIYNVYCRYLISDHVLFQISSSNVKPEETSDKLDKLYEEGKAKLPSTRLTAEYKNFEKLLSSSGLIFLHLPNLYFCLDITL